MVISKLVLLSMSTGKLAGHLEEASSQAVTVSLPDLLVVQPTLVVSDSARLEVWVKDGEMLSPP
jgi:hypothetical protein